MNPDNHFKLHWTARSIELQDVDIPSNHVLVGLQFEEVIENDIKRLRLVALSKPFNFTLERVTFENEFFESRNEPSR